MKNLLSKITTSLEGNYTTSVFAMTPIVILILCFLFLIPSSASDESSEGGQYVTPTDLTGTIWEVSSGWNASAGYGQFDVTCSISNSSYKNGSHSSPIYIGYRYSNSSFSMVDASNTICFKNGNFVYTYVPTQGSFIITITGGADVTNSALISWLMNNATWTNPPEPDPDPDPDPEFDFYLPTGIYEFHRFTPPSLDEGEVFDYKGTFYFENTSYSGMRISCIENTVNVYMLPKTSNTYQLVGSYNDPSNVIVGKRVYLPFGVYADSEEGLTVLNETLKPSPEDDPLMAVGFMISGVFSALDEFVLFSGYSLLDFIYTCIGLLAAVWFLKLLAGG